jgi:undecaprenyl-diphosphatase
VVIERFVLGGRSSAAVEDIFGNPWIIATGLAAVGFLIIGAGFLPASVEELPRPGSATSRAVLIGAVQGLALPFRGFSRSGSTISVGLLTRLTRGYSEEFSFALAVILTIPVVGREALRLRLLPSGSSHALTTFPVLTGIIGMVLSFAAGLVAIRWLSAWLEKGKWGYFGFYCLALSGVIFVLAGMRVIA